MELEIGPGPQAGSYTVRVLRSLGGGQPTDTFVLDVDELVDSRRSLESSVLASSISARRVMTDRESAMQSIGIRLFEAVFGGAVEGAYRTSVAVASERGRVPQLVLRLTAPGLAALPWETLFDSETGRYLCRKEPLVRRVPAPYAPDTPPSAPPLQILGMIASPRGLPFLDTSAEKERLEEALRPQLDSGHVELTWLDDVSWAGLHNRLLQQPWHVLHFIGHGGYDIESDEGLLALVGSGGRPDYVSASRLADLLDEADPTPRLVVLNSCQSGAAGATDLFSGTASALVRNGIHAVVAMQFAISDVAAIAFARGFYVALASGRGIDEAVRSGRIGILGIGRDTLEWVTPVLYLRGDDTRLLDVPLRRAHPAPVLPLPSHDAPTETPVAPPPALATTTPTSSPVIRGTAAIYEPTVAPTATGVGSAVMPPRPPGGRKPAMVLVIVLAALVAAGAAAAVVALLNDGDQRPDAASSPATTSAAPVVPVELAVPADAAWTATGVECGVGDVLRITATGTILHAPEPTATVSPDGLTDPIFHQYNVEGLPDANTVALIGSLDAELPYFVVGSSVGFACPRAGELFLGINDLGLEGNSGEFTATVIRTEGP